MTLTFATYAWIAVIAYAVHMMEEYQLDWRGWARAVIGLNVEWGDFVAANSAVVIFGIAQGQLAATGFPLATLTFAALMLINATAFHVAPVIWTRGRFSPGLITAVLLFYPVGIGIFVSAAREGLLTVANGVAAFGLGGLLMASPIVFIHLRQRAYFRQAPPYRRTAPAAISPLRACQ